MLKIDFAFLSPVQVVKVTNHNLQEAADWCGGKVAETESRRRKGQLDKYVWVPTPSDNNISWAFPGMYITKRLVVTQTGELRATYAVYRRDYYEKNYFESPAASLDATWDLEANKRAAAAAKKIEKKVKAVMEGETDVTSAALEIIRIAGEEETDLNVAGQPVLFEVPEEPKPFVHEHKLDELCDEAGCTTDRYVDGKHVFSDHEVIADKDGYSVLNAGHGRQVKIHAGQEGQE